MVSEIILFILLFLVLYNYVIYPLSMIGIAKLKKTPSTPDIYKPKVSIIIPAHNESAVIEQKLNSIFAVCDYPHELIEVLIGSDFSTDNTNEIVRNISKKYPQVTLVEFNERQGKIKVINTLINMCQHELVISTDANIIFTENTIANLVSPFANPAVGLVDAAIRHTNILSDNISEQEDKYISIECKTKQAESILFKAMAGPFGACYCFRKSAFNEIPTGRMIADDFYINMQALTKGYQTLFNTDAIVLEDSNSNSKAEYKRRVRIASGCWTNFAIFFPSIINPFTKRGFIMLSHKVLRWFVPFFLILIAVELVILAPLYTSIAVGLVIFACGISRKIRRYFYYFISSNIAIIHGLYQVLFSTKTTIWTPTPRK